ncbi:beta-ketoacyl-ACP synthase III [Candidatus Latescibacterota bacterium]
MKNIPVIKGLGFNVPEEIWDNRRLEQLVDTSDEWIRSRTGIHTRHIAGKNDTTATLASDASRAALADAGLDPLDVDAIIVATMTPEMLFPATACFVQDFIGAKNASAFDISAACTGFIYSLSLASSMISSGSAENVIVIGAETLSRIVDWTDRNTCVLFGDGAGAAVVSLNGEGAQVIDTILGSDGSNTNLLYMPGGGSRHPASETTVRKRMHFLKMTGKGLYKEATTSMANCTIRVLEKNGLDVNDMDLLIPHQANLRIILSTAKKLEISPEKAYVNIQKYGNTSAATIPIALTEARDEGRINKGDIVVLVGFGSGMTWGASLLRF